MSDEDAPMHNILFVFSVFEELEGARILTCFIFAKLYYDDFAGS